MVSQFNGMQKIDYFDKAENCVKRVLTQIILCFGTQRELSPAFRPITIYTFVRTALSVTKMFCFRRREKHQKQN